MPLPQTKKITDRDDRETTLTALPVRNARAKMGNVNESTAPLSDVPFKPTLRFYLAFVAISSLTLAAAVDATSLSIALPIMTKELGGSAIEAFWAGTSFLITSAILMPIYAALSHIFGRKPLMHLGAVFFAGGSILGALATDMMTMLIGRAIQGVGAGGVVVLGEIIITDLVPLNERGKWLGWLGTMWTIGGLIGPLTGGVFAQYVTWRWVFWINLPFIVFGSVMLQIFLNQETIAGHAFQKFLRVDWFGAVLFMTSTAAILIPLTCGGILLDWKDWRAIVPMFLGFDGLIAFIYWENVYATEPMIRLNIFQNWSLRSIYLQTALHALVFWAMFYYLPLYYQVIKGYSPLITGIAMLPETLVVSPMTVVIGILINKYNRYRWSLYGGWFFTTLGAGLFILLDLHTPIAVWIIINVVACIGIGTLITSMNFAVQAAVSSQDCGHAVAFYVFLRQFGEGLGVAVGGVIFQNRLRQNMYALASWHDFADEYSQNATTLGDVVRGLQAGARRDELVRAYVDALKMVWLVMCAISAAGLALTLLVKSFSMDKKLETEQGFVGEQRGGERDLRDF